MAARRNIKGDEGFVMSSRRMPDGQFRGHVGISCKTCGHEEWRVAKNPGWGHRIFTREGWFLGARRSQDECPSCVEARLMPSAKRPKLTIVHPAIEPEPIPMPEPEVTATAIELAPAAEAPRQPTWADNRRIRAALDDAYDADAGRYFGELSDEKVAADLNLPRAWVSTIRELFGPDRCEMDDTRRENLTAVLEFAAHNARLALEAAEQADRLVADIRAKMKEAGL